MKKSRIITSSISGPVTSSGHRVVPAGSVKVRIVLLSQLCSFGLYLDWDMPRKGLDADTFCDE